MKQKSLWHITVNESEIREENLIPNSLCIEIEAVFSGISLGTETLVSTGKIPVSMYEKMKVPYMVGNFNFPIKYGYSLVGKTKNNELVHIMHPHQTTVLIDQSDCYFFSEKINPIVATQFSNLETIVNAIWISEVKKNDIVLVCGTGSIGILLAQTLKEYVGAEVYVKETNEIKLEKLKNFGFEIASDDMLFDISYNVSANENGLQYCIDHMVVEGKIIELSWYGNQRVQLQLGADFHYKRLQIISSQVSEIPIKKQDEFNFFTRKKLVEQLMLQIDFLPFISSVILFEALPQFFSNIRNNKLQNDFITIVKY